MEAYMANVDRPSGARPIGHLDGSPFNGMVREYSVDAANAAAIFPGDFVKLEADGNVTVAAAGNVLLGVCVSVKVDPTNLERRYLPASTAGTILVADSPDTVFEIQESGGIAAADIGLNADILATGGSASTGQSAHELNSAATGAATAQLRILRHVDREDNAVGTNSKLEVFINEHLYKAAAGI